MLVVTFTPPRLIRFFIRVAICVPIWIDSLSSLKDKESVKVIEEQCKKIEELVDNLGISTESCAVITDGDLAIPWKDCCASGDRMVKFLSDLRSCTR